MTGHVLRANAIAYAALGITFGLSTWDQLYDVLGVSPLTDAFPAQLGGILAVALAFLLWTATRARELVRPVAAACAFANAAAALLCAAWLIDVRLHLRGHHALLLGLAALGAGVLAVAEARIAKASRSPD